MGTRMTRADRLIAHARRSKQPLHLNEAAATRAAQRMGYTHDDLWAPHPIKALGVWLQRIAYHHADDDFGSFWCLHARRR